MAEIAFDLAPWQSVALNNPFEHFAFYGGVATGKSYTGSQFSIDHFQRMPNLTGFIGANTYDQLSQATLRELFYWLGEYGYDFVIDQRPPLHWGSSRKKLKTYHNVLSVRVGNETAHAFTRVLSKGDRLRGLEFSWYWLDETRDTPENTHNVILSRMRESDYRRGLITTTTNGEAWDYQRFVKGNDGTNLYGSMHVPTIRSVEAGIITRAYYDTMLRTYSPLLAEQELEAKHVNVLGGRAYYAAGEHNRRRTAPWGDRVPNRDRKLIIGCDFNFSPAPCVWMVGQLAPDGDSIHWFNEVSGEQMSTVNMTSMLLSQFPDFFYQVFGDLSGDIGTTSNAGETDYNQISQTMGDAGALFSIDVDQGGLGSSGAKTIRRNPLVKARVENMNALFKNALGEVRQTYNPDACPLFDADTRSVGWKPNVQKGRGRLDDGGDVQRTHATDGGGYAVFKLFPPGRRGSIIPGHESPLTALTGSILGGAGIE